MRVPYLGAGKGASVTDAAAVAASSLNKTYRGGIHALRDFDIEIRPGEITALVGPNGAGKTTFLKVLLGFEDASSGDITVFGLDPWRERVASLKNVGYVAQATGLYGGLSVNEHLEWAEMTRKGFDRALAAERIRSLGIEPRSQARKLSGGQQAQLTLAIALATHARLLLLDEPLASLDPLARREFLQTLRSAARADGTTVILTSHIVSDVEEICTSVAVISSGRLQAHAPIADALRLHVMTDPGMDVGGAELIAVFAGRSGHDVGLWRRTDSEASSGGASPDTKDAPQATLEELVLGYLARDRQQRVTGNGA
jgi:ABC-2 type transport system ATP-binding protein